ncbi:MAG: hypothetical protein WKF58_15335 [Ilumatobacteraceae bacterium]
MVDECLADVGERQSGEDRNDVVRGDGAVREIVEQRPQLDFVHVAHAVMPVR